MDQAGSDIPPSELNKIAPEDYEFHLNKLKNNSKKESVQTESSDDSGVYICSVIFIVISYFIGLIIFFCTRKDMTIKHQATCKKLLIIFGCIYAGLVVLSIVLSIVFALVIIPNIPDYLN
jgi:hypothetical protein